MWQTIGNVAMGLMDLFRSNKEGSAAAATKKQYEYNLKLQQQAQAWNEYMYKNRYQMQVEDLENAGINRLYGLGNAPAVTSGMNSVGMPDMVNEKNNKVNQLLNGITIAQNLSAKRAEIKKLEQETKTEQQNTRLRELQSINEEIRTIESQNRVKYQDQIAIADLKQRRANLIKTMAETNESNERAGTARQQIRKLENENVQIERINRWHEEHPKLSNIITGSEELKGLSELLVPLASGLTGGAIATMLGKSKRNNSARKVNARHRN